ncbi:MAG: class I SAM-dependent methyltransferase [Gammaproteobacteria bacterium]|nr:class I SAM-dependent methyltransferase [Gammaproteobacteria bacterium]
MHYESIPIPESHPRHLASLGRLFEIASADPQRCRVLELGCATGGNIIPLAWHHPQSRFLGVDLSAAQIDAGRALLERLRLDNIELRQGDILELDERLGRFDYIVVHGVYSWVPQPVRAHLLELAPRLLAPAGLLYLSYNTLPGWRTRSVLRDFLCYACRDASGSEQQLTQAYAALDRLEASLGGLEALSARSLRAEIAILRKAHPSYLLYEHLGEENTAFMFSDFLAEAERNGLAYLCDSELATMFPATYGDACERALGQLATDLEVEQWLDFVSNRGMRRSLLCRNDASYSTDLSLDNFADLAFTSLLLPPAKIDWRENRRAIFRQADGAPVEVSHPLSKAMLLEMIASQPDLRTLPELLPAAQRRLEQVGAGRHAEGYQACLMELFSLFAHRALEASPRARSFPRPSLERPRVSVLTRAQLEVGSTTLATALHGALDLDTLALALLQRLDGERDVAALCRSLAAALRNGTLEPPAQLRSKKGRGGGEVDRLERSVRALLADFVRHGLLAGA